MTPPAIALKRLRATLGVRGAIKKGSKIAYARRWVIDEPMQHKLLVVARNVTEPP